MIVSYKLLQTYFDKKLPKPEVISDTLTFHSFEIEGMEKKQGGDVAIDVKVLPNRAHDCLSHQGIAREISAILNIPLKKQKIQKIPRTKTPTKSIAIELKDKRARRYMSVVVEGVVVKDSPKWLQESLQALGQRSINNVVDATNFVMFAVGQPLHAFDLDKISGGKIMVRPGKEGESITTLDGKTVALDEHVMVIADSKEPLGIAGIKGGTKAEVDQNTTAIVLESANFDASTIRLTSQRLDIKTDASKRFESGLSPYLSEEAMRRVAALIVEIAGGERVCVGSITDKFPNPPKSVNVDVSLVYINHLLGIELSDKVVHDVWKRLHLPVVSVKKGTDTVYRVSIPPERLDLRLKQDLVEEVGRIVGYRDLPGVLPVETALAPTIDLEWKCREVARQTMLGAGFSEVYTYTFNGNGEIAVANPIASDKKFLRNNLMSGLKIAVLENLKYESAVRIFEFGHIFGKTDKAIREERSFAALVGFQKRKEADMKQDFFVIKGVLEEVLRILGVSGVSFEEAGGELVASVYAEGKKKKGVSGRECLGVMSINGFEIDFGKVVALSRFDLTYDVPSRFPSIVRDVSLFVPIDTKAGHVESVIRENAEPLVQSISLIDVFEQPEQQRKSFAFRMILQSNDRTLSDEEANGVYNNVARVLTESNSDWIVRT